MLKGFQGTAQPLPVAPMSTPAANTQTITLTAGPVTAVIRLARAVWGTETVAKPPSGHMRISSAWPPTLWAPQQ